MTHFSALGAVAVLVLVAWPVIAVFAAVLGLVGLLRKRVRQGKAWRITMVILAIVLVLDTIAITALFASLVWSIVRDLGFSGVRRNAG